MGRSRDVPRLSRLKSSTPLQRSLLPSHARDKDKACRVCHREHVMTQSPRLDGKPADTRALKHPHPTFCATQKSSALPFQDP